MRVEMELADCLSFVYHLVDQSYLSFPFREQKRDAPLVLDQQTGYGQVKSEEESVMCVVYPSCW